MRIYTLFIILFLSANVLLAQSKSRAHRHPLTIDMMVEWKDEVKVVEVPPPDKKLKREGLTRNRFFEGFSVFDESGYGIFFTDRKTKKTYKIQGGGLVHRPFSDLWWKNSRLFVFDWWSGPYQGAHYEFDAKTKEIKKILVFRDADKRNQ